jgi:hypothetical protein
MYLGGNMTLPESVRRNRRPGNYKLGRVALSGKFSVPADEPPADDDSKGDDGAKGKTDGDEKTIKQSDLSRLLAREKGEGKRAAEKAIADALGVPLDTAKDIIKRHREAEDANKSEAEKERAAAAKEREAAEEAKREAAVEVHEARIERALAAEGFTGDEKKMTRVRKMVTIEVGATYEDVLADVKDAKKDFPELFIAKDPAGDDGKKPGKLTNSDPAGRPPKPNGGEDKYDTGAKRFAERNQKHRGLNPLAKKQDA